MKLLTLITAAGTVSPTAFAGEPAPVQTAPAPAPTLGGWFAGVGFGQFESDSNFAKIANGIDPDGRGFDFLANPDGYVSRGPSGGLGDHYGINDFEFEMYTFHVGRDLGTQFLGCDLSAYLEVGYLDGDANMTYRDFDSMGLFSQTAGLDIEIIPITLNLMAQREFFAGIKGYISAGIGYAFTDASFLGQSENDGGFYAQASMGLAYNVTEQWQMYGGARWLYLGDLDLGFNGAELDDSVGYEIGLRYSF